MIIFYNTEIHGVINMMSSFEKIQDLTYETDSGVCDWIYCFDCNADCIYAGKDNVYGVLPTYSIGKNDLKIIRENARDKTFNNNYEKFVSVSAYVCAPLYWWNDFNTYRDRAIVYSNDLIVNIHKRAFERCDFCLSDLVDTSGCEKDGISEFLTIEAGPIIDKIITTLNASRENYLRTSDEIYLRQIYQLLPSCYFQESFIELDIQELLHIYNVSIHNSKSEWNEFRRWCENIPWFSEIYL